MYTLVKRDQQKREQTLF